MDLREECHGDAAAIGNLHGQAFPTQEEARLVDSLRGAGRVAVSLVVVIEEPIVGHVLFSPVTVEITLHGNSSYLVQQGLNLCRSRG